MSLGRTGWISGKENAADILTKKLLSHYSAMGKLIETNKLKIDPIGWASQNAEKRKAKGESYAKSSEKEECLQTFSITSIDYWSE